MEYDLSSMDTQVFEVTARLHSLGVLALRKRFPHLPFEIINADEPFPHSLRLITSSHCDQRCQYPEENVLWCHSEGIARDALNPPPTEQLLAVVHFFMQRYGIQRVKIGGLQPVVGQQLFDLIAGLRQMGISDVSFTTNGLRINGRLWELKDAGVTRITLSIHSFDQEIYQRITGRYGLADAIALVKEAQTVGLTPIKVNRVLLRNYIDDLPALIGWICAEDLTVRLFDLMWHFGQDRYYIKYLISWQDLLPIWEHRVESLSVHRYSTSGRVRVSFKLRGGGHIEVNLMRPKYLSDALICQSCELAEICAEGYLGCGIRITPDMRLSPCILRNELSLDLLPLCDKPHVQNYASLIDKVLAGSFTSDMLKFSSPIK